MSIEANGIKAKTNTVDGVIEKLSLTKTHYFIITAAALGFMFDSFDTYVVSYAMPAIIQEWQMDQVMIGVLNSAGIWGMFLGAFIWGPVTDRFGRKIGFIGTILGFSILCGLTVLSQNPSQFLFFRFVTGLCLGGMIPVDTALTSEYVAARYRGRFVAVLTLLWPFGLLAAALCALNLITPYGWRILFIIGVIPAFLSFFIRAKVPESPRWLAIKGRAEESKAVLKKLGATDEDVNNVDMAVEKKAKVPVAVLLQPQYRKRFVLTAGYYFFGYFGYYGFVLWFPTILATVYGLDMAKTFTYTFFVALSAIAGRFTAFYTIEKFGRKQLFFVGFGLGGVAALLFGLIKDPSYLVVGACILSYLYEQAVAGTVAWTPELYPSEVRATATSWSTGFGRISSAVAPIVFGGLLKAGMYYGIYISMAVSFWIAVLLVAVIGIETKGKSLHEVGAE